MLEIRNLSKTYKSKGGVVVKALDDVTVTFPETGMVFLLGKSGSGKSTLLNVCGGLDTPDEGEIIVRGRSSKTFSGSDFDSYRNTFVGFIFQEYNILNEFTVEENLSLALELQGKKKDKARVEELLEQVDLKGYGRRKPNTLSGGQKQRIAIARALIKDPKIIMADEPTGALDSATGKQVFDTLKKLSSNRLVIVVSHDREFAEVYGDRIIELKDGKIISDVSKQKVEAEALGENISAITENTLSIKSGSNLSDDDLQKIRQFILGAEEDVIISNGKRDIASFKQANRIDDSGSTEHFEDTETDKIVSRSYTKEESTFVRSKLPASKALKMGASSLKVKRFRLVMTILLSVIAFILFGVSSTLMTYNEAAVLRESYANSSYQNLILQKNYQQTVRYFDNGKENYSYTEIGSARFTQEDLNKMSDMFDGDVLCLVDLRETPDNVEVGRSAPATFNESALYHYAFAPKNSSFRNMLYGNYPEARKEIAISNWYAELILYNTFTDADTKQTVKIGSIQDLLGKKLALDKEKFVICGIFDGGKMPENFDGYNEVDNLPQWTSKYEDLNNYYSYVRETLMRKAMVSETFVAEIATESRYNNYDRNRYFNDGMYYYGDGVNISGYSVYGGASAKLPVVWFGTHNSLVGNEVVLSLDMLASIPMGFSAETKSAWQAKYANIDDKVATYEAKANEYSVKYDESRHDAALLAEYKAQQAKVQEISEKLQEIEDENSTLTTEYNQQTAIASDQSRTEEERNAASAEVTRLQELIDQTQEEYRTKRSEYYEENKKLQELSQRYGSELSEGNMSLRMSTNAYSVLSGFCSNAGNIESAEMFYLMTYLPYFEEDDKVFVESVMADYIEIVFADGVEINVSGGISDMPLTLKVVGYYVMPSYGNFYEGIYFREGIYVSSEYEQYFKTSYYNTTETKFNFPQSERYYDNIAVAYNGDSARFDKALGLVINVGDDDSFCTFTDSLYDKITSISHVVMELRQVFFYIGLVLAVFAAMLLFNFISVSINNKTHEIGVLRAVGARGSDVFKIFFSESLIISAICLFISIIGTIVLLIYLNATLTHALTFSFSLFVFGPLSFIMMVGVAAVVAFLGTFLPVLRISRKKPVDSMRTL